MPWQAHTRPKRTLTCCYMWRSAPSLHAHLRDRVAHPERHAAKIMGRARTICYRRKQLACSNRVPIVARRSKCGGAGGPSASTLAGEPSHRPVPPPVHRLSTAHLVLSDDAPCPCEGKAHETGTYDSEDSSTADAAGFGASETASLAISPETSLPPLPPASPSPLPLPRRRFPSAPSLP